MGNVQKSIAELQDKIVDDFLAIGDPLSQYEYLLEFAASLPKLDAQNKIDENLVEGCQSRVWLILECKNDRLSLTADSDTLIVRGILNLLIEILDGQSCSEVAAADLYFLREANLMMTFNEARRKGIGSAIASIKAYAASQTNLG
ncbi:Fe-S metabolism protein SufE [Gordonibacter sp. 28C]|uniref:SufE family protein n=1 Tax=Gordonibacter sp. 28C TaxID=2078569 RepID=UPI000DF7D940|nr:SufE family protein [Gordonibacter sp. 28C]RDB63741.1 Fe-S metabolism protein SufE [Gordonibacter sp. 28C]